MALIKTDSQQIKELLQRGVAEIIDRRSLEQKLKSGKALRVKLGIDPTSPNLHLGRSIPLLKMRDFQELGHKLVFIVGDFTAVIGDTSDKDSERPMLTRAQVMSNLETYLKQAGKVINLAKTEVHHNSEWLGKLTYADIGEQADVFSLAEFMSRENISKRYKAGKRVSLREILYPLMQGYDSVMVKADVELGGTDQRFNLLAGRQLQQRYGQKPQDLLMNNLIEGTDGRKMSSSWGNTINLTDSARDMFGKVMRLRDESIITYFLHCTRVPMKDVALYEKQLKSSANPRDIKMLLATAIVNLYYNQKTADSEAANFTQQFSQKQLPADIALLKFKSGESLIDCMVRSKAVSSKSEARRLVEQGGIKINQQKVVDSNQKLKNGDILQVGKRNVFRLQ